MTAYLSKITGFFGSFSGDMIFLVTVFILFFAYTMYFGRGRMLSFILAFYPAAILFKSFPYLDKLIVLHGDKLVLLNKIVIFFIFLIPLDIIINKFIFSESEYSGSMKLLRAVGLAISATLLVVLFSYGILNFDIFHNFSPTIDAFLANPAKLFYSNLAPLALLFIL
jgi:hypothetical protein